MKPVTSQGLFLFQRFLSEQLGPGSQPLPLLSRKDPLLLPRFPSISSYSASWIFRRSALERMESLPLKIACHTRKIKGGGDVCPSVSGVTRAPEFILPISKKLVTKAAPLPQFFRCLISFMIRSQSLQAFCLHKRLRALAWKHGHQIVPEWTAPRLLKGHQEGG